MATAVDVKCPKCGRRWTKLGYNEDYGKEFVCKDCDPAAAGEHHSQIIREHNSDPMRVRS